MKEFAVQGLLQKKMYRMQLLIEFGGQGNRVSLASLP